MGFQTGAANILFLYCQAEQLRKADLGNQKDLMEKQKQQLQQLQNQLRDNLDSLVNDKVETISTVFLLKLLYRRFSILRSIRIKYHGLNKEKMAKYLDHGLIYFMLK